MLLQCHVASLGSTCSAAWKNELLDRQWKLEARISAYEQLVSVIIKLDDNIQWGAQGGTIADMDTQAGKASDDLSEIYPDKWFMQERE
jgi:hypothetical protein